MNKRRFRGFGMALLFSFRCYLFNTKVALDSNNTLICNLLCISFSSELLFSQHTKTQEKLRRGILILKSLPQKVALIYTESSRTLPPTSETAISSPVMSSPHVSSRPAEQVSECGDTTCTTPRKSHAGTTPQHACRQNRDQDDTWTTIGTQQFTVLLP